MDAAANDAISAKAEQMTAAPRMSPPEIAMIKNVIQVGREKDDMMVTSRLVPKFDVGHSANMPTLAHYLGSIVASASQPWPVGDRWEPRATPVCRKVPLLI
ncbi:hypothetical protein [Bradyrhizobium sp.]|uniref:hypothetical protein n=1 Tax=Bradyrhizobium sp. TaxID=376 RepID=UPI002C276C2D|nr:hypothetical protein [Bradyrhizobium sp.]HWX60166.1 hypothetical protein [Bradyrhizobium sp.]